MGLEVTGQERDLLLELIEKAEEEAIQGMDHADSRAFKDVLRNRLRVRGLNWIRALSLPRRPERPLERSCPPTVPLPVSQCFRRFFRARQPVAANRRSETARTVKELFSSRTREIVVAELLI